MASAVLRYMIFGSIEMVGIGKWDAAKRSKGVTIIVKHETKPCFKIVQQ